MVDFPRGFIEDGKKRNVLVFANHNAYEKQAMQIRLTKKKATVSRYDRKTGGWVELKPAGKTVAFEIGPAGAEVLRVEPQN